VAMTDERECSGPQGSGVERVTWRG
jgi:hypothetical protein